MRVVLDYGGVLVEHGDERAYADILGISPDEEPYPGWLAYSLFRSGFLETEEQYTDVLSTLTGASEPDCLAYIEQTWLDPDVPTEHPRIIEELADEYVLILFSNMAKPWVETVLQRHDIRECFDELLVSSDLGRPKPHPRGYQRCVDGVEDEIVMVSDEYNEDLLMADCFGMTTVWVATEDEDPLRDPDVTIDRLAELPPALERIEAR